jgi:hypothetical protein
MRTHAVALLSLLLALAVATVNGDAPPTARVDVEETHELAALGESLAWHLAGRRAVFRVAVDSDSDEEDGQTLYDCRTADGVRTV